MLCVSDALREQAFTVIQMYCSELQSPEDGAKFIQAYEAFIWALADEMTHIGPLGGLLMDLNVFNTFTVFRNSKMKKKVPTNLKCDPLYAIVQSVLKYVTERTVMHTDRIFVRAACSNLVIPQQLAIPLCEISVGARKRASGAWKKMGSGRRGTMNCGALLQKVYLDLNTRGLISEKLKAFLKLSFPFLNPNNIIRPLKAIQAGQCMESHKIEISTADGVRRKAPNLTMFAGVVTPDKYPIPDILLCTVDEDGVISNCTGDVSQFLVNPQHVLAENPLAAFERPRGNMQQLTLQYHSLPVIQNNDPILAKCRPVHPSTSLPMSSVSLVYDLPEDQTSSGQTSTPSTYTVYTREQSAAAELEWEPWDSDSLDESDETVPKSTFPVISTQPCIKTTAHQETVFSSHLQPLPNLTCDLNAQLVQPSVPTSSLSVLQQMLHDLKQPPPFADPLTPTTAALTPSPIPQPSAENQEVFEATPSFPPSSKRKQKKNNMEPPSGQSVKQTSKRQRLEETNVAPFVDQYPLLTSFCETQDLNWDKKFEDVTLLQKDDIFSDIEKQKSVDATAAAVASITEFDHEENMLQQILCDLFPENQKQETDDVYALQGEIPDYDCSLPDFFD